MSPQRIRIFTDGSIKPGLHEPAPPPEPINFFTVPDNGKTYWIHKRDFQLETWEYKPRSMVLNYKKDPPNSALPDMFWFQGPSNGQFTPLNEKWQHFFFNLLVKSCAGTRDHEEMLQIWHDVMHEARALNDNHSREKGYADYIEGVNLDSEKGPMAIAYMTAGGNLLEQVRRSGRRVTVRTLDADKDPPDVDAIWGDWSVIHFATETGWIKLGRRSYQAGRWAWCRPYGTPFPFIAPGGELWTDVGELIEAVPGRVYSWYNLATA